MAQSRYPDNWDEIALSIKEASGWRCCKCTMQCFKPGEVISGLTKSERMKKTLTVHHSNYRPEDNRTDNLIPLCTGCHLNYHTRKKGNISINQLELFEELSN